MAVSSLGAGPLILHAQVEAVEKARITHIEAELTVRHRGEVPAPIGHEEGIVVLEHELGKVCREGRGEDVVVITDGDGVSGLRTTHAERAWPARLR